MTDIADYGITPRDGDAAAEPAAIDEILKSPFAQLGLAIGYVALKTSQDRVDRGASVERRTVTKLASDLIVREMNTAVARGKSESDAMDDAVLLMQAGIAYSLKLAGAKVDLVRVVAHMNETTRSLRAKSDPK